MSKAPLKESNWRVSKMEEVMGVPPNFDLSGYYPKIKIVGIGGAGNNIVDYITKQGIKGAETIAINTCLLYTSPSPRD